MLLIGTTWKRISHVNPTCLRYAFLLISWGSWLATAIWWWYVGIAALSIFKQTNKQIDRQIIFGSNTHKTRAVKQYKMLLEPKLKRALINSRPVKVTQWNPVSKIEIHVFLIYYLQYKDYCIQTLYSCEQLNCLGDMLYTLTTLRKLLNKNKYMWKSIFCELEIN